jgi:PTS system mannose-specific IIA component
MTAGDVPAPRATTLRVGVVVVTHGQLAVELVNAAEAIVGDLDHVEAVSIGWHDDAEQARLEIGDAIARVATDVGTLVLTDMFGGTPSNLAVTFLAPGRVEVVTGVNLPMVVKFAMVKQQSGDLATVAHMITEKGSKAIRVASDLLTTAGVTG